MKNILVPTDFSACATNAANVALQLAASYGATLHLYSNIDIKTDTLERSKEDERTIHNAELLLSEWREKAAYDNVTIETAWSGGKLTDEISKYVANKSIDFVVMGSHGLSGKNEFFIGSNTQKIVRTIRVPVLVVKEDMTDYQIKKVVFASNFNLSEKEPFQYLLKFLRPFNPEIHLIQINTSGWFREPYLLVKETMDDFKEMCGEMTCKTHFFRDWTIEGGIRHMSNEIAADLIAISNQQRHPLKRIFAGSNVEALINHASAPVLSIDLKGVDNTKTDTEMKKEMEAE